MLFRHQAIITLTLFFFYNLSFGRRKRESNDEHNNQRVETKCQRGVLPKGKISTTCQMFPKEL